MAAGDVTFPGDPVPDSDSADLIAHLVYDPDEFMPDYYGRFYRLLGPRVPIENVQVSPADRRFLDFDSNVIHSANGFGNILFP